jgi:uncharacterized metal-binding protein
LKINKKTIYNKKMENSQKIQIVSCSGASNTGKYADDVARQLSASGEANMICLAKVAIGDKNLIKNLKAQESKIIVLDGCVLNCAEKILAKEGITNFIHLNTTDFGIVKGKTPVTAEKINEIIEYVKNTNNE